MPPCSPQPMGPAFRRCLLYGTAGVVVAAVICFAVSQVWFARQSALRSAVMQAEYAAAGLQPESGGDVSASALRILGRLDGVIAVATLSAAGSVQNLLPDRPTLRTAMDEVVTELSRKRYAPGVNYGAVRISISDPVTGKSRPAHGVVTSVNGSKFKDARRVAFLIRNDWRPSGWMTATTLFAAPVAATGMFSFLALSGWFRHRVTEPLRSMTSAVTGPSRTHARRKTDQAESIRQTSEIAALFDELMHGLASNDAKHERFKIAAEREQAEREHRHQRQLREAHDRAVTDSLTGLKNRAFLEDQLESIFDRVCRGGEDLAAVLIDVDNFKQHNDANGHQAGDQLLRFIGSLLRGCTRQNDYAIRYGGDEFLLLLPDCDARQAESVAQRIVKLFGQYARRMGPAVTVSLSAGVAALSNEGAETGHDLVAHADHALYSAKRVGKNTVASAHDHPAHMVQHSAIAS